MKVKVIVGMVRSTTNNPVALNRWRAMCSSYSPSALPTAPAHPYSEVCKGEWKRAVPLSPCYQRIPSAPYMQSALEGQRRSIWRPLYTFRATILEAEKSLELELTMCCNETHGWAAGKSASCSQSSLAHSLPPASVVKQ